MNTETDTLINVLRNRMESMCDGERKELVEQLIEDYCKYCMSDDLPCYCWRDE